MRRTTKKGGASLIEPSLIEPGLALWSLCSGVLLLNVDVDVLLNAVLDALVVPSLDGKDVSSVE